MTTQDSNDRAREIAFQFNADLPRGYQKALLAEALRSFSIHEEKRILLVGGAGYIGSVLTSHLLLHGYSVHCLDLLLYDNHSAIEQFLSHPRYEFIKGDFTDESTARYALKDISDVVILAGLVGDPITKKYPEVSQKINLEGTLAFIDLLKGRGLSKVVFISTCSNYGLIPEGEVADENFQLTPLSLYAKAKVAIEQKLLSLKGKVDYHPTILRFATAFGRSFRMRFDLTVNEFTRELFLGHMLTVYDADTWRPYCHVKDFSLIIRRVLEAPVKRVAFEVFNAGGDVNNLTKRMVVGRIKTLIPSASVEYKEVGSDRRNYRVDFSKIRRLLFFEVKYALTDGIKELIDAFRKNEYSDVEQRKRFYGNYHIDYQDRAIEQSQAL